MITLYNISNLFLTVELLDKESQTTYIAKEVAKSKSEDFLN